MPRSQSGEFFVQVLGLTEMLVIDIVDEYVQELHENDVCGAVELYIECVATWNNGNDAFFVARILSSTQFRSRDIRYRCYVSSKYTVTLCYLQGGPKMAQFFLYALTSSNINRFSKLFFQAQNREKMYNNTITKNSTTPQVCRYTTLWNVKCLKSNNRKQDDFSNNTLHMLIITVK